MSLETWWCFRAPFFRGKGFFLLTGVTLILLITTIYRYSLWHTLDSSYETPRRMRPLDTSLNGPEISMDDPQLVNKLRKNFLETPPDPPLPLNLSNPELGDSSMGQSKVIRSLLNFKRNGFFVECGALDGELRSNTLYLERYLGWTGLLVEADPDNYRLMQYKHRNAWISNACFSLKPYPMMVSFRQKFNRGAISDYPAGEVRRGHVDVQCFPILTFLLAVNRTTVDYLSLDIEGGELDALYTVPFDRLDIKVLSVEFVHVPQGKEELQNFMESKGYLTVTTVTHANSLANDFIFQKKS